MMKENKKYELVEDDFIIHKGRKLYRIRALKNISPVHYYEVHEGELGGYVEGYHNLSQEGYSWVYYDDSDSKVYGNAVIEDDAEVYGNARIEDDAVVKDNTEVAYNSKICDNAEVCRYISPNKDGDISGNSKLEE